MTVCTILRKQNRNLFDKGVIYHFKKSEMLHVFNIDQTCLVLSKNNG